VLVKCSHIMSDHNVKLAGHIQNLVGQCLMTDCYFQPCILVHFWTYSCYGTQEKSVSARENNDEMKKQRSIKVAKRNTWYSTLHKKLSILIKPFLTPTWGKQHYNTLKAFQPNNRNYKVAKYKDMFRAHKNINSGLKIIFRLWQVMLRPK